jgi:hypothetical protein
MAFAGMACRGIARPFSAWASAANAWPAGTEGVTSASPAACKPDGREATWVPVRVAAAVGVAVGVAGSFAGSSAVGAGADVAIGPVANSASTGIEGRGVSLKPGAIGTAVAKTSAWATPATLGDGWIPFDSITD